MPLPRFIRYKPDVKTPHPVLKPEIITSPSYVIGSILLINIEIIEIIIKMHPIIKIKNPEYNLDLSFPFSVGSYFELKRVSNKPINGERKIEMAKEYFTPMFLLTPSIETKKERIKNIEKTKINDMKKH